MVNSLVATPGLELEAIHFGPPPQIKNGAWTQYCTSLQELNEPRLMGRRVYDRFLYGEQIYSKVLDRHTDFTAIHRRMLERVLLGMNARTVICLPPWEAVWSVWYSRRDEELLKFEAQLMDVYQYYYGLLQGPSDMVPHMFDYTNDYPLAKKKLVDYLVDPDHPTNVYNMGPGIGAFIPGESILLVGEQLNATKGYLGWPFVSLQGSSTWLAQQLEDAKISERSLYWVNAKDEHGNWTHPDFIETLQPKAIIALGSVAAAWLSMNSIPHTQVYHPQAWKRFRSGEDYPLIAKLQELIGATHL